MLLKIWLSSLCIAMGSPVPPDTSIPLQGLQLPGLSPAISQIMPSTQNASTTALSADIGDPPVLKFHEGTRRLSARSCLMVALETLVNLSFLKYNDPYTTGQHSSEKYPDVAIIITRNIMAEIIFRNYDVVYGLVQLITSMMDRNAFRNSEIGYTDSRGRLFATLAFSDKSIQSTRRSDHVFPSIAQQPDTWQVPRIINGTDGTNLTAMVSTKPDDPLLVFAEFYGTALKISEIFSAIYNALAILLVVPTDDPLLAFDSGSSTFDTWVTFEIIQPRPSGAPAFTNRWAARTLQLLPEHMFQEQKFNEIKFIAGWENNLLANGSLAWRTSPPQTAAIEKR